MEALILYLILFLPSFGSIQVVQEITVEFIAFSAIWELNRLITYTLPALALLWYIILGKNSLSSIKSENLQGKDLIPFAIGLPGLMTIAIIISFSISFFSRQYGMSSPPVILAPSNLGGWLVMIVACLGTGYLEETYFRYYLLTRLENYNLPSKVILSTLLFTFCHIHDGPWGLLNAFLAGILLSLLFLRYKSLHGIALAHGFYNIFVYTIGIFL